MYDTANVIHCGTEAVLAQASSCLRGIVSAARALDSCTLYLRNSTACRGSTEIWRGKVLPWRHIYMLISNSRLSPVPTVGAWFCRSFLSDLTPEAVLSRVDCSGSVESVAHIQGRPSCSIWNIKHRIKYSLRCHVRYQQSRNDIVYNIGIRYRIHITN